MAGRHPRGFPDPVGWILAEYGTKRIHDDPIQTDVHDFCPKSDFEFNFSILSDRILKKWGPKGPKGPKGPP